ncbi:capsule biosynthesis GfcC family protein [Chromatiaceae bacterium AAb-1]|nr:capsule biosynthesis GfcC family protein [Chromatiaceae bacterium AAb-1]
MFYKFVTTVLFLYILHPANALADVRVVINSQSFSYTDNPRLAEVLAPVAGPHWYWPAAALYQLDNNEPEQLRQLILQQLTAFAEQQQDNHRQLAAVQRIKGELSGWQLAKRIRIPIDYDLARTKAEFNPRFEDGDYLLRLTMRPSSVYAFGLLEFSRKLTHLGAADVTAYLPELKLLAGADKSRIYIIQPDGQTSIASIAYWNKQHREVMPGGQLFIPFATEWFATAADSLNQQIIELATHRVLP